MQPIKIFKSLWHRRKDPYFIRISCWSYYNKYKWFICEKKSVLVIDVVCKPDYPDWPVVPVFNKDGWGFVVPSPVNAGLSRENGRLVRPLATLSLDTTIHS